MISHRLVQMIETHAEELTERWLNDIRVHGDTPTYRTFPVDKLRSRAAYVFAHPGRWVESEKHRDEVEERYRALGTVRFREGFPLSEVVTALILSRKQLWHSVLERGLFDSAVELFQALELFNNVVLYFDRAVIYAVCGYEEAQRRAASV